MKIHSAVGRRTGLSREEISDLFNLDAARFERREWLALRFAQDWAFLDGHEPSGDYMEEFAAAYSPRERARIRKLLRMMQFANYWNNRFNRKAWNPDAEGLSPNACRIDTLKKSVT